MTGRELPVARRRTVERDLAHGIPSGRTLARLADSPAPGERASGPSLSAGPFGATRLQIDTVPCRPPGGIPGGGMIPSRCLSGADPAARERNRLVRASKYLVLLDFMVGGIGIEPMTFAVSRQRSPAELTARAP